MKLQIKNFDELSVKQLHQIYQLRVAVFVVEQNCAYQEVDEIDGRARHVWLEKNGQILAYLRIYQNDSHLHLGRVLVHSNFRKHGYAKQLLHQSLDYIRQHYTQTILEIAAQSYLLPFYRSFGFKEVSTPYLEDGIEHVDMQLLLQKLKVVKSKL